jgi:prepilin-type processing-associated H-X9-DG protein
LIGNVSQVTDDRAAQNAGLAPEARAWVAAQLGGDVVHVERFTRGRQAWWVDVRTTNGDKRWMLKGRRAPAAVIARSHLLTAFGAAREAAAMRALAGHGIPVPLVGGFDTDLALLLIERIPGSALLQRLPEAERDRVIKDYARQLGALHQLDWRELDIDPAIAIPAGADQMVVGEWLETAEADAATAATRQRHAEPLLDLAVQWLHRNQPAGRGLERLRLLHGDAGVNNFLFADGRVTALIDWELAIVADPMSDLGNARYREALYPTGTYPVLIEAYEAAIGEPVDRGAVSYYTALAATMLSLGMVANVHRPRAGQPEVVARLWQDALARCIAAEAIAEASGVTLEYDATQPDDWSPFDAHLELLAERLERQAPLAEPGQPAAEALAYAQLGVAARAMVRSGAWLATRLLDDAAQLLGTRPATVPEALGDLAALVATGPSDVAPILTVLARDARRRLQILRPLQAAEVWEDAVSVVRQDESARDAPVLPAFPAADPALPPSKTKR